MTFGDISQSTSSKILKSLPHIQSTVNIAVIGAKNSGKSSLVRQLRGADPAVLYENGTAASGEQIPPCTDIGSAEYCQNRPANASLISCRAHLFHSGHDTLCSSSSVRKVYCVYNELSVEDAAKNSYICPETHCNVNNMSKDCNKYIDRVSKQMPFHLIFLLFDKNDRESFESVSSFEKTVNPVIPRHYIAVETAAAVGGDREDSSGHCTATAAVISEEATARQPLEYSAVTGSDYHIMYC
jgi:hypothetical protein